MDLENELKSNFTSDYHKAYLNMLYTNYCIQQESKEYFNKYGITPQQFNVLRILRGSAPTTCSINDIKERIMDKSSDVSRIVTRLLSKDLISKKIKKEDKRVSELTLSEAGFKLLEKIDETISFFEGRMQKLSDEEVKLLNQLLDKLRS